MVSSEIYGHRINMKCNMNFRWYLTGFILLAFAALDLRALGGLQIITSDIMQGGGASTNLTVTKIQTNAMRIDFGSASSVITLPASSGQPRLPS